MASPSVQRLDELPGRWVLERRDHPEAPPPEGWLALVRAPDGLSVVRPARDDDGGTRWAALFSGATAHAPEATGMLAALLVPLAQAGVPVMVASTHAADVVLVPEDRLAAAAGALRAAGHEVALA